MSPQNKKVFLVRETFTMEYGDQPIARKTPAVWAFPTLTQATACRDQLVKTCRHVNPFRDLGQSLQDVSSMEENQLREHVRSLGLPSPGRADWGTWWYGNVENLTDEQLAKLWAALDKAQPYAIEESEANVETESEDSSTGPVAMPKRKAYVVQRLCWQYNDNWHDLGNDEPIKAFLDPELAELYRLELEEPEREVRHNPCRFAGGLEYATSLPAEQLLARLTDLGIAPPPLADCNGETVRDFSDDRWWNRLWNNLTRWQVHQVWNLFDKVRFYEVIEIELEC